MILRRGTPSIQVARGRLSSGGIGSYPQFSIYSSRFATIFEGVAAEPTGSLNLGFGRSRFLRAARALMSTPSRATPERAGDPARKRARALRPFGITSQGVSANQIYSLRLAARCHTIFVESLRMLLPKIHL